MLYKSLLALIVLPPAFATPAASDNPFEGKSFYANSMYASKLEETIKSFCDEGDLVNAARVETVQRTGTFGWVASFAAASKIAKVLVFIDEAHELQESLGKPQIVELVVYNLPDRDCSARASDGELKLDQDGLSKYKQFVDSVAKELCTSKAEELTFAIVLEPDSLANLVTNMDVSKCAGAATAYKEGVAYAISKLQFPNVHLYIDAGHCGWLGWDGNLLPSAKLFAEVLELAAGNSTTKCKVRGPATNVSNYNAYIANPRENFTKGSNSWDESHYVNSLAPHLESVGFPAKFIVDQGRAGKLGIRREWGQWCNVKNAGFGIRPSTNTGSALVDAFVWVKPGGESDGTSDPKAARFDKMCVSPLADTPAPEAGAWFNDYVKRLVVNANPELPASSWEDELH
ncbi:Glycoside Hydrolase Family 6 protein [Tuber magnatum]|uniref:Glucanase n=1 Tax=Tuber magnatum TaxID=42249 RepID=A0A317SGJ3_9PEZI|nr:Glycoside Hydrolase Family 6 protein [Tuber magnatum]